MPRILLLLPTTTYRTADFLEAARRLRVDVTVASEEPSTLEGLNPEGLLTLDFRDPVSAARRAVEFAARFPVDAVVGVDDDSTVPAAAIAEALRLPHNTIGAVLAARHKATMRRSWPGRRCPQGFRLFDSKADASRAADAVTFPCVLEPRSSPPAAA